MNMLIDLLPEIVIIEGTEYEINSNFRVGIMFELLMTDYNIPKDEKLRIALQLYYPVIPRNVRKAIEEIQNFYASGKIRKEQRSGNSISDKEDKEEEEEQTERIYSFEFDDDYIYSAFITQYNIDLQDIDYLHWWKFKALFKSINEDNLFSKIMTYRAIKINNDMTDKEKEHYRKLKRIYALPDLRSEEEKENDFQDMFSKMFM